ncbi:hypothetical protein Tco_1142110 [Tanacetum coccineum]
MMRYQEFRIPTLRKDLLGVARFLRWVEAEMVLLLLMAWMEQNADIRDCVTVKELGAEADEPMVGSIVDEIPEPIVEMEEQVIALVIDIDEDIAMLFGDDDFSNDDSEGFEGEEEVWEVNEEWLMCDNRDLSRLV